MTVASNLYSITNPLELQKTTFDYYKSFGASSIIYHLLPPPGAKEIDPVARISWWGFPIEWARKYSYEKLYETNPILRKGLQRNRPFKWSEVRNDKNLSKSEAEFMRKMEGANLGDGLAFPVYGANGYDGNTSMSFRSERPPVSRPEILKLQMICQLSHQRYCEMLDVVGKRKVLLSGRELEIARWISEGKSNSTIAEILGISRHTVDTYVKRIYAKLDVTDRVSAALRSMSAGALD